MDRRRIAVLGTIFAIASTAALAQTSEGPDFSPMKPESLEGSQGRIESNGSEQDARLLRREPTTDAPIAAPSYTEVPPATQADGYVVREPARAYVAPPAIVPGQATIDHGLFNREGVNDFGA